MPLGAFYGSLAASASVIIGILSAFLVNRLVSGRQERRQLDLELQQTENELEWARAKRDEYQERKDEIEAAWRSRDAEAAHENINDFLEKRVTADGFHEPPESVDTAQIAEEFANFVNDGSTDGLTDVQMDVLRSRGSGIRGELAIAAAEAYIPDIVMMGDHGIAPITENANATFEGMLDRFRNRYGIDNLQPVTRNALQSKYSQWQKEQEQPDLLSSQSKSTGLIGSHLQTTAEMLDMPGTASGSKSEMEIQERNRNRARLVEAKTSVNELERKKRTLQTRLQSLSLDPVQEMLRASAIAIVLTVVIPLLTYLCYELNFVLIEGSAWIAPMFVFGLWIVGLLLVLLDFRSRIFGDEHENDRASFTERAAQSLRSLTILNDRDRSHEGDD